MAVCPERLRLMNEFNEGLQSYAKLVEQSLNLLESGQKAELDALRKTARLAWGNVEEARLAVYRHETQHGCDRGSPPEI